MVHGQILGPLCTDWQLADQRIAKPICRQSCSRRHFVRPCVGVHWSIDPVMISILVGPNFSGRSRWLGQRMKASSWPNTIRLTLSAEATFTGLTWTVNEELEAAGKVRGSNAGSCLSVDPAKFGLKDLGDRELHVLSGGEM